MSGYRIEKDPTGYYLKWRVVTGEGNMAMRFETKKLAQSLCDLLNGDLAQAPVFYRLYVARMVKKFGDEEGWKAAAQLMAVWGLGPQQVRADPNTGEPL